MHHLLMQTLKGQDLANGHLGTGDNEAHVLHLLLPIFLNHAVGDEKVHVSATANAMLTNDISLYHCQGILGADVDVDAFSVVDADNVEVGGGSGCRRFFFTDLLQKVVARDKEIFHLGVDGDELLLHLCFGHGIKFNLVVRNLAFIALHAEHSQLLVLLFHGGAYHLNHFINTGRTSQ